MACAKVAEPDRRLLEEATASLDQERAAFEAEKAAMSRATSRSDDLLELNVGGRIFSTLRGVLTREEDGLLARMFSGRWEQAFKMDKQGRVFLDFDPDCFEVVLYHLRLWKLTGSAVDWCNAKPPQGKESYFEAFLAFLGLTWEPPQQAFGTHSEGVVLEEGGRTVTSLSDDSGWAVGSSSMQRGVFSSGVFTWGFRVNRLPADGCVVLGVIGVDNPPAGYCSCEHATSNGWDSNGHLWKNGLDICRAGDWHLSDADVVTMRLNVNEGLLQMKIARLVDSVFEAAGLELRPWHVHVWIDVLAEGASIEVFDTEWEEF